jgi:hypothetical protein
LKTNRILQHVFPEDSQTGESTSVLVMGLYQAVLDPGKVARLLSRKH